MLNPDNAAQDLMQRAAACQRAGNVAEAEACFRQVLMSRPDHPQANYGLGVIERARGRLDVALTHLDRAVAGDSGNPAFLFQRAYVRDMLHQKAEAIEDLKGVLVHDRGNVGILSRLGDMLIDEYRVAEAMPHFLEWVRLAPDDPVAHAALAHARLLNAEPDKAESAARRALELDPEHVPARVSLANVLLDRGDFERAYQTIEPVLERGKTHPEDLSPGVVYVYSVVSKRLGREEDALRMIEGLLESGANDARAVSTLHARAGLLLADQGDYDAAFAHFQRANTSRPNHFDPAGHTALIDAIVEAFSEEALGRLPVASHAFRLPVFVVGMPRSGTTLVEQIIASHPEAEGVGELSDINRLAHRLPQRLRVREPYPGCIRHLDRGTADQLAETYNARLRSLAPKASRVVDKLPHNFLHLGLIDRLFPAARVIHCRRDPVDTCLSCYFQNFYGTHDYARDLTYLGHYYREYERLMEHWRKVLRIPMLEVQYEELVEDPERVSREIIGFLGLDWDDACLRFYETRRTVHTASVTQVRQPIYKSSTGRWRKYEKHLGPLLEALGLDRAGNRTGG